VTALLAAAGHAVFGDSLVGLRALALASGAGVVVLSTLMASDLGGGRRAQITAAIVAGLTPFVLAENTLFQPVSFDLLVSALLLWLALRLTLAPSRRLWIAIGITVGVGLETKYTVGVLAVALLIGFAVSRRDVLRVPDVALAAAIALALFVPNLIWQAQHDWASIRFFLHPGASATDESRPQLVDQVSSVVASAHPSAVIAENYGEAGALELYGRGLPAVVSGHMSFRYWRPAALASRAVVVVGYDRARLAELCSRYSIVRRAVLPYDVDNEEQGAPIATCTLRGDLDAVWPQLVRPKL